MRKNNKRFVGYIMAAAIAGLIILMIVLFMLLRTFLEENQTVTDFKQQAESEAANSKVELSESLLVLVHNITDKNIEGYDIKNSKLISKQFADTTRISDAYGNVIPITEIKVGDIVELECRQDSGQVFVASKASNVQTWRKISGITVDTESEMISVGGSNYQYTENTMILKKNGSPERISNIGPYDIVTVQVYDNVVWSIMVDESYASFNIKDLPVSTGTIEIDNSRLINFSDITEPIKVIPGEHRIVARMQGYEVFTDTIKLASGEVYDISLADVKEAYTIVNVQVYPYIEDYEVKIGDTVYKPGEEIKLQQGKYEVTITADGYEPRKKTIVLTEKTYPLTVTLKEIEQKTENSASQQENNGQANNQDDTQVITFTTQPVSADVYVDGINVGKTPYAVTLTYGSHSVLFEKDGYETYNTNIIVSDENNQRLYLYTLDPK